MIYKTATGYSDLVKLKVQDWLLKNNLVKANRNYTKFIILGRARTGSTYLSSLLNSHSQILTFGELFRDYDTIGWDFPFHDKYMNSEKLVSFYQNDPLAFLEDKIFKPYSADVSAVGFKLFYYHARNAKHSDIWDYLKSLGNLKIIHLKRENTLRMILSEQKAFKTDRWTNLNGEQEPRISIKLDYDECLSRFESEKNANIELCEFFKNSQVLDLYYEDLLAGQQKEIDRVLSFLCVNLEQLIPLTHRQANQPLEEAIYDYHELKYKFLNTEWGRFFDE